jgi:hypothetical protein
MTSRQNTSATCRRSNHIENALATFLFGRRRTQGSGSWKASLTTRWQTRLVRQSTPSTTQRASPVCSRSHTEEPSTT